MIGLLIGKKPLKMGFGSVTICVLLCTIGPATVSAYEVFFSISYSNSTFPGLKGSTATLTCSGVLEDEEEKHLRLHFFNWDSGARNAMWYYSIGSNSIYYYASPWDDNRMSSLPVDSNSTGVTFNITNLDCIDEYTYMCRAYYYSLSVLYDLDSEQTLSLMVEPREPTFEAFPSLSNDVNEVLEYTELTVYCSAVTGSPMKGSLHWRIYRDGIPEDIDDPWSDSRVVMTNGSTNCEETYASTLTLDMSRTDQKVAVACFVINEDFRPRSDLPSSCLEEPVLCNQTRELLVLYGVSESAMDITSVQDTFSCQADSVPAASIIWTRAAQILPGVDDGQGVITMVLKTSDPETYTCTATNIVNGVTYSASKDVHIFLPVEDSKNSSKDSENVSEDSGISSTIVIAVGVVSFVIIVVLVVAVVWLYKANMKLKREVQANITTEQAGKQTGDTAVRYSVPSPPKQPHDEKNSTAKRDPTTALWTSNSERDDSADSRLPMPKEARVARDPVNKDGPDEDYVNLAGDVEEEDEEMYAIPADPTVKPSSKY